MHEFSDNLRSPSARADKVNFWLHPLSKATLLRNSAAELTIDKYL